MEKQLPDLDHDIFEQNHALYIIFASIKVHISSVEFTHTSQIGRVDGH